MSAKSLLPTPHTHTHIPKKSKKKKKKNKKTSSYHNLPTSRRPLRLRSKTGANASSALHPRIQVRSFVLYMQVPNHFNYPPLTHHLSPPLVKNCYACLSVHAPGSAPPTLLMFGHPVPCRRCWYCKFSTDNLLALSGGHASCTSSQTRARSTHYSLQLSTVLCSTNSMGGEFPTWAFFWNVGIPPSHPLVACTPSRTDASLTLSRFGPSRFQFYINSTMTLSIYDTSIFKYPILIRYCALSGTVGTVDTVYDQEWLVSL